MYIPRFYAYAEAGFANRLPRSTRHGGMYGRIQLHVTNHQLANHMKNTIEQQQNGRLQTGVSTNKRFSLRNRLLLMAGAIGLLAAGSGQAQPVFPLPFYEPFPSSAIPYTFNSAYANMGYENGEELGQSVTEANSANSSSYVWTFGNSATSSSGRIGITNGESGLEYPGLFNVDGTYQTGLYYTYIKDTSSTKSRAVQLAIPANSRSAPFPIYASCLFSIQTNKFTGSMSFLDLTANTGGSSVAQNGATIWVTGNGVNQHFQLQISKNSGTPDPNSITPVLTTSNTYLLVLRYNYTTSPVTGTGDTVDLWVNPITLGSNYNAAVPTPTLSTTNGGTNLPVNFFGALGILEYANPCIIYIDEIRVATNWGGVTPTNAWANNIYSVTGGVQTGCGSTAFPIGLSGSDNNVTYWLYTNGVATGISATGTGSSLSFGSFSATATYTVAGSNNTATPSVATTWMSGSASISVYTPVSITTQPSPLTVPSGELGVFSVGTSGTGQIYQWYKNGAALQNVNEFSGVTTSNLVIYPVTSADVEPQAHGYYVVISNICGNPVTSTPVALSLGSPGNLTWSGDGVSNLWDVGISENWSLNDNGTTNDAYFNYGDNVTFDDTSANTTVNLNSSYLSPSTLTVNGSANNYVFNGPGGLAGDGSIVLNSTATTCLTLNLGFANTETGGITINPGATLVFDAAGALGTGVITLNGGQLAGGSSGAVYANDVINVTGAGSSISVNSPGGQNLYLSSILEGTSGSLTFSNITTHNEGMALVILQYPGFTFNLPVDLENGSLGGHLELAGENTSGVQEWTAIITGTGIMGRNGAGGETLLDNANSTYSGGVMLTAGPLGVSSDSVITSGSLVSGPLGIGDLIVDTRGGSPQFFASGAAHFVANPITWYSNILGNPWLISGSYPITFGGAVDLNANLVTQPVYLTGTNRAIVVSNSVSAIFTNVITDDGNDMGLTLSGTGNVYLDGLNTYTGTTTNDASLLAGTGSVAGNVQVNGDGTLGAGDPSGIGTFTIGGNLSLAGNLFIRMNKSLSPALSNDTFFVSGGLTNTGTGTVTVTNIGTAPMAVGDTFQLFNAPLVGGSLLAISDPTGVTWTNNLAANGTITVTGGVVNTTPGDMTFSVSGRTLTICWPNHLGWTLQSTTSLSSPVTWTPVAGSTTETCATITMPTSGTVFYRLFYSH
jgi:hypothetical protein